MAIDPDLAALDLDCVVYKVCRDEGLSLKEAEEGARQYRAFLHLIRHAEPGFEAAPTRLVDQVWHHHILDTQKYAHDCEALFGRFIHHFPYSGIFDGEDAATQAMRKKETNRHLEQLVMNDS